MNIFAFTLFDQHKSPEYRHIISITQAQVYVFVLTAIVYLYIYLAFASLVIVVEHCSLLCYEVI